MRELDNQNPAASGGSINGGSVSYSTPPTIIVNGVRCDILSADCKDFGGGRRLVLTVKRS